MRGGSSDGTLSPVFRMAPYAAEERRKKRGSNQTQILFLDEGNDCRAILGSALLLHLIRDTPFVSDVSVASASIGPAEPFQYSSEVIQIMKDMGVVLNEENVLSNGRVFRLESDPIDNDLLLVMDRFDQEEVYKEVSVLDTINPSGYYSSRLKILGEFCRILSHNTEDADVMEIGDPWYGTTKAEERAKALRATARKLLIGCQGLLIYLKMLNSKCLYGLTLQVALIQSLRCPVMEHSALSRSVRMNKWKPIWKTSGSQAGKFFTLRDVGGGEKRVVRKSMSPRKRYRYWQDIVNVEKEILHWMRKYKSFDRLPKYTELRETGYFSLSVAIVKHGGRHTFLNRLNMAQERRPKRKPNGYWYDVENVERELKAWMAEKGSVVLPTRDQLRDDGRHSLACAIRLHGGITALARRLETPSRHHSRLYWHDDANLKRELLPFLTQGRDGALYMPSQRRLRESGRQDVLGAIFRRGGFGKVASLFGWKCRRGHRVSFARLVTELQRFADVEGLPTDRLPPLEALLRAHRHDLLHSIAHFGGLRAVEERLQ